MLCELITLEQWATEGQPCALHREDSRMCHSQFALVSQLDWFHIILCSWTSPPSMATSLKSFSVADFWQAYYVQGHGRVKLVSFPVSIPKLF